MDTKKCCDCGIIKNIDLFTRHFWYKDGHSFLCKDCKTIRNKLYWQKRKLEGTARIHNDVYKRYRKKIKIDVMNAYGSKCQCCDENRIEFLTIDHKNNDGYKDTNKGLKLYRWLRSNNYPTDFQILCMNCNGSLGLFGYCPHKPQIRRETHLGRRPDELV